MFDCITCGKVFTHKGDLNRHSKIHDGSTISCVICAKVFTQQSNLSRHTKNVHKAAGHTNDGRNAVRIGGAMDRPTVINWAPALATAVPRVRPAVAAASADVAVPSPTAAAITNRRAHAAGPSHASTAPATMA